jgi:hypothetical protein
MDLDTSERLGIRNHVDGSTVLLYRNLSVFVKARAYESKYRIN